MQTSQKEKKFSWNTWKGRICGTLLGIIGGIVYHFWLKDGYGSLLFHILHVTVVGFAIGFAVDA